MAKTGCFVALVWGGVFLALLAPNMWLAGLGCLCACMGAIGLTVRAMQGRLYG